MQIRAPESRLERIYLPAMSAPLPPPRAAPKPKPARVVRAERRVRGWFARALELFTEQGFRGTTTPELARTSRRGGRRRSTGNSRAKEAPAQRGMLEALAWGSSLVSAGETEHRLDAEVALGTHRPRDGHRRCGAGSRTGCECCSGRGGVTPRGEHPAGRRENFAARVCTQIMAAASSGGSHPARVGGAVGRGVAGPHRVCGRADRGEGVGVDHPNVELALESARGRRWPTGFPIPRSKWSPEVQGWWVSWRSRRRRGGPGPAGACYVPAESGTHLEAVGQRNSPPNPTPTAPRRAPRRSSVRDSPVAARMHRPRPRHSPTMPRGGSPSSSRER
jgi:hypothetical protein